jgi:hypothetical protein
MDDLITRLWLIGGVCVILLGLASPFLGDKR